MAGTGLRHIPVSSCGALALRAAVVTAVVAAAVLIWYTIDLVALLFAAVIVAVVLRSLMGLLARITPLRGRWALAVVVAGLLLALLGLGVLIGSHLAEQFGQLTDTLRTSWVQLHTLLATSDLGREVLRLESQTASASSARLAGAATSSIGALIDGVLILFIGLFLAAEPDLYRRGILSLVPRSARGMTARVMNELGEALTRWLGGVAIAMLCVGTLTSACLALLGIPLALSLGILAGACEFVAYLGPIVSSIPAILVAFTLGTTAALEVVGLYLLVHALEGYVLVPIIQKRAVALPPALALFAVVLFGLIFGPLGVVLAHPLMVAVIVLVRRLYIQPESVRM